MEARLRGTALLSGPDTNSDDNHLASGAPLRWGWVPRSSKRAASHLGMSLTHCVTLSKTLNLSEP